MRRQCDGLTDAIRAKDEAIFRYLLAQGAKLDEYSFQPLWSFSMASPDFQKWLVLLVEAGADQNTRRSYDQDSLLHLVVRNGNMDLVKLLAEKVDINCLNKQQVTPLAEAVVKEDEAIFQYLLKLGAKADIGNPLKSISLQSPNFVKWFLLLLDAGADPSSPLDKDNNSALHLAVQSGKLDFVQLLAEKGADLNCHNKQKRTSLHLACLYGNADITSWLIEKGADTTLLDMDKKTAVQLTIDPNLNNLFLPAVLQAEQSSITYSFFNPLVENASKIQQSKNLNKSGDSMGPK